MAVTVRFCLLRVRFGESYLILKRFVTVFFKVYNLKFVRCLGCDRRLVIDRPCLLEASRLRLHLRMWSAEPRSGELCACWVSRVPLCVWSLRSKICLPPETHIFTSSSTMGIQLPHFLSSVSSYGHPQVERALHGHSVEVTLFTMSLAILFVFVISRMMMFLNGLRVGAHVSVFFTPVFCIYSIQIDIIWPQTVNYLPGLRIPFQPLLPPGAALPTSSWNPGMEFHWFRRFDCGYPGFAIWSLTL